MLAYLLETAWLPTETLLAQQVFLILVQISCDERWMEQTHDPNSWHSACLQSFNRGKSAYSSVLVQSLKASHIALEHVTIRYSNHTSNQFPRANPSGVYLSNNNGGLVGDMARAGGKMRCLGAGVPAVIVQTPAIGGNGGDRPLTGDCGKADDYSSGQHFSGTNLRSSR